MKLGYNAENDVAIFMKRKLHLCYWICTRAPCNSEQAEHCLMALDKAQVKMTLVGNSFMETETIVLRM